MGYLMILGESGFWQRAKVAARVLAILATVGLVSVESVSRAEEMPAKVTYVDHVQPIFRQHCFACHGADQKKSDLALDNYPATMKGGASGEVLVSGDPASSRLWALVNHDEAPEMPVNGARLPPEQLAVIKAWIEGGLLEKGDSVARKPSKPAVAAIKPAADNRPVGDPAMPQGVLREPVLFATHRGAADALATSPWAPLAAVAAPYQIALYNTDSGELLGVLPFIEGTAYTLRFSRDGSILLAGGGRSASLGVAALYDVKSGRRLTTLGDELDSVLAADLMPDHSLVALGGPRKVVRVYRVADGSLAYEITKHTDWITAMEFSPDGKLLATADRGGGLFLWDAQTGRERGDLRGHTEQINAVSWRSDSAVIASASEDDTVKLWQPDGQQLKSWAAHGGGVTSVQFARDGQLVTSGRDQLVRAWKPDGAAIRDIATLEDLALAARYTHDGVRVVASDWRGNVKVFEAASGNALLALDPNPPTIAMRMAGAETEVNQLRQVAQDAQAQLTAAQQQVAAAESALNQARTDAEAKTKAQAEKTMQLTAAEQRLAAAAADKAALDQAAAQVAAQLVAIQQELASAEAAASAVQTQQAEAEAQMAKQQAAVTDVTAQVAALQEALKAAQAALQPFIDAHAAKVKEMEAATARTGELRTNLEQLQRRQSDLEAIQKLRQEHEAKK